MLSPLAKLVLAEIKATGGGFPGDIARAINEDVGSVVAVIDELEEAGLVWIIGRSYVVPKDG